jgi:hypothetical protein
MNGQRDTIAARFAPDHILSTPGDLSMIAVRQREDDFNQCASNTNEMHLKFQI